MWEYFGQVCKWNKCYDRETGNYFSAYELLLQFISLVYLKVKTEMQSHHSKNLEKNQAFNGKIAMQPESSTFNQGIKLLNRIDVELFLFQY